mmetsp:Transcript_13711/g.26015  ORF Transcript_13711/g.26015 Transcript_13711/m.26015 type:complete len:234 (+) Transcript_13711:843-1544(+)
MNQHQWGSINCFARLRLQTDEARVYWANTCNVNGLQLHGLYILNGFSLNKLPCLLTLPARKIEQRLLTITAFDIIFTQVSLLPSGGRVIFNDLLHGLIVTVLCTLIRITRQKDEEERNYCSDNVQLAQQQSCEHDTNSYLDRPHSTIVQKSHWLRRTSGMRMRCQRQCIQWPRQRRLQQAVCFRLFPCASVCDETKASLWTRCIKCTSRTEAQKKLLKHLPRIECALITRPLV